MKRKYMLSKEFKDRQMWLDFGAIGDAYETLQKCVLDFRAWFKVWKTKKVIKKEINKGLWLCAEWCAGIEFKMFKSTKKSY